MNVIKIDASPRISIVRAKELILAALPTEKYAEVYFFVAANGEPDLEGEHQIKMAEGKFATPYMERYLPEIFEKLNIIPCMINLPNMQGFRKGHEILYNISQQEFVRLAEAYGCNVEVSVAKSDDGLQKIDIAPDSSKSTISPIQPAKAWKLKTSIQRFPGYRYALYEFLRKEHAAGKSCPKARDVLDAWRTTPPLVIQVMTDGVKYNDGKGNPKEANLKAIQQAIKGILDDQAPNRTTKRRTGRTSLGNHS